LKIRGDIRKSRCNTDINDTSGKIATGVNDTGGKFPPVSTILAQICHRCQRRRWQIATGINGTGGKFATCVNDTSGKQWEQLSNY
jgi:hypothetical protein